MPYDSGHTRPAARFTLRSDATDAARDHAGHMTTTTFTPTHGAADAAADQSTPRLGGALRAVKSFVSAAIGVAVLGEFAEEAGVKRR